MDPKSKLKRPPSSSRKASSLNPNESTKKIWINVGILIAIVAGLGAIVSLTVILFEQKKRLEDRSNCLALLPLVKGEEVKKNSVDPGLKIEKPKIEMDTKNVTQKKSSVSNLVVSMGLLPAPVATVKKGYRHLKPPLAEGVTSLPTSYDVRDTLKKQGKALPRMMYQSGCCGSCWAFATATTMSYRLALMEDTVDLSPQWLISLTEALENKNPCGGNDMLSPLQLYSRYGMVKESDFPYAVEFSMRSPSCVVPNPFPLTSDMKKCSVDISCINKTLPEAMKLRTDVVDVFRAYRYSNTDEDTIKREILLRGPVVGGLSSPQSFIDHQRTNMIIRKERVPIDFKSVGGHAVSIIGWGEENGVRYWIVHNSWSPQWGHNGYGRVEIGALNFMTRPELGAFAGEIKKGVLPSSPFALPPPTPTPPKPAPTPTPAPSNTAPAPPKTAPTPAPVLPTPASTPPEPAPAPTPSKPTPTPAPSKPAPAPAPAPVLPTPAPPTPAPTPAPVLPTPIPPKPAPVLPTLPTPTPPKSYPSTEEPVLPTRTLLDSDDDTKRAETYSRVIKYLSDTYPDHGGKYKVANEKYCEALENFCAGEKAVGDANIFCDQNNISKKRCMLEELRDDFNLMYHDTAADIINVLKGQSSKDVGMNLLSSYVSKNCLLERMRKGNKTKFPVQDDPSWKNCVWKHAKGTLLEEKVKSLGYHLYEKEEEKEKKDDDKTKKVFHHPAFISGITITLFVVLGLILWGIFRTKKCEIKAEDVKSSFLD